MPTFPAVAPLLFFWAVAATAMFGDLRSSITATILSAITLNYFLPPEGFSLQAVALVRTLLFTTVAVFVCLLAHRLRQARRNELSSDEQMRMLVTSISESFIALDREWRFQYANQRVLKKLNKHWDEIVGKSMWEVFPAAVHSEFKAGYEKVMQERVPHTFDVRLRQPDGTISIYQVHAYPTPQGLSAIVSDITEQNRSVEERFRLAAIVESSDDAIVSKDLNGIVQSWNKAAERIFGYTAQEIIGRSILSIIPLELQDEEPRILANLRAGKKIDHYETQRVRKDGTRIDVSLTISPVKDINGNVIGASKIARDISDRKRVQEALLQSEKLAATGRMAAVIAHEVNNPLEAATNLGYLISTDAKLSDTARRFTAMLMEQIARASEITKQTLAFYRDSGSVGEFDVRDLMDNVIEVYRPLLEKRDIEVVRDYRSADRVVGYASEIRQVFANLLLNAIDAVPEGGKIITRVGSENAPDGHSRRVRVSVADTGHGVSPEARKRLFEPFVTTKGSHGNGLGLWVSAGILKKHGGKISVRTSTAPGRSGTVFSIVIPVNVNATAQKSAS